MKIINGQSYNIVYDDLKDDGSGSLAHLLAKTIFQANLDEGFESGEPFISEKGVSISNFIAPSSRLFIISLNKSNKDAETIDVTEDINYVIQYLLKNNQGFSSDIRRVKALTKGLKKTQSYRKYLRCFYILICELPEEESDQMVKDSTDFGMPFYIKAKLMISLLSNLTRQNVNKVLYFRSVWSEENLLSICLYLTGDRELPSYVTQDFTEEMASTVYQTNLINMTLALGQGTLNKYLNKKLVEFES